MNTCPASPSVILVVDDAPAICGVLVDLLAPFYEILTADSGASALEVLRRRRVDLVVLDVAMPGMTGMALLERLRADGDPTPIILLPASTTRARRWRR